MRRKFSVEQLTARHVLDQLRATIPNSGHFDLDIRDRQRVRDLFREQRPDFIIHTAAQPSHDRSAAIPYDDFDVNAAGTMTILGAARHSCSESPLCCTSTNKFDLDSPNQT